jgi:hypothetical protein
VAEELAVLLAVAEELAATCMYQLLQLLQVVVFQ